MPVVWGVYPWKDLVLASDMNSGLWIFRVTGDAKAGNGSGSGSGASGQAAPAPEAAPNPAPAASPTGDPGGRGVLTWAALAGLALGLLAAGAVVRSARRHHP
jgi:hypothetical protein